MKSLDIDLDSPHQVGHLEHVYQVVNEDEYSDIVRKRQEEDWVIDDGMETPVSLKPVKLVLSPYATSIEFLGSYLCSVFSRRKFDCVKPSCSKDG